MRLAEARYWKIFQDRIKDSKKAELMISLILAASRLAMGAILRLPAGGCPTTTGPTQNSSSSLLGEPPTSYLQCRRVDSCVFDEMRSATQVLINLRGCETGV